MKNFFNLDNPFMIFLSNLTDVIILNVICIVCCLPIVTIGASLTAMHYVTLKMVKGEDGYLLKSFFKSFKENFKQSTIIWMIFLVITVVFFLDFRILENAGMENAQIFKMVLYSFYLLMCFTMMYVFPVLSRFENTIKITIKNAFFMSIIHVFKTIIMAVIYVIPMVLIPLHTTMIPVYFMIGLAGPAYINSYFWKGILKKYEPQEEDLAKCIENSEIFVE